MTDHKLTSQLVSMATCGALLLSIGCSPKTESMPTTEEANTTKKTMSEALTETQKIHRTLGYAIGSDLMLDSYTAEEVDHILAGMELSAKGEQPDYVAALKDRAFQMYNDKRNHQAAERGDELLEKNKAAGEAFLAKMDEEEGVVKTESGLRYKILKEGSDKFATRADSVKVHYHGTLIDGTVFDSSVDRNEPIDFPLSGVVPGFSEGLTLVGEGGKIALYMPSDLAYGDAGRGGPIGPGVTLIFEVELLKINP